MSILGFALLIVVRTALLMLPASTAGSPIREFIGKTLMKNDLIHRFGIQIIAIKKLMPENVVMIPTSRFIDKERAMLFRLRPDNALTGLEEESN